MSQLESEEGTAPQAHPRRPRADARRNREAILDAAARLLAERPDASMAEIAQAAGVMRQTVYGHFLSRDALLAALLERATERVIAALDAADLDAGPADQALVRLMEVGWRSFDTDPFLLHLAQPPVTAQQDRDRHEPILTRLSDVIVRGRQRGEIDPALPTPWILSAVFALGHAAGEEVRAGRITSTEAIDALRRTIPRLVRPEYRTSAES